jgi:Acetyl-coenzyme A transporter 1
MYVTFASMVESWIQDAEMVLIVLFFTTLTTGLAIKDIANDSWVSSFFDPEETKYGPNMESMSQLLGEFMTGSLFLLVNSEGFREYFGFKATGNYLVSYEKLFMFLGFAEILTGLAILFFVPDKSSDNDRKFKSVFEVFAILPKLAKNPSIRKSVLFLSTCAIGNSIFGILIFLASIDLVIFPLKKRSHFLWVGSQKINYFGSHIINAHFHDFPLIFHGVDQTKKIHSPDFEPPQDPNIYSKAPWMIS